MLDLLRQAAEIEDDPTGSPPLRSAGPDDDYLVALADAAQAVVVSGDGHLLDLADRLPVYSPANFIALLKAQDR